MYVSFIFYNGKDENFMLNILGGGRIHTKETTPIRIHSKKIINFFRTLKHGKHLLQHRNEFVVTTINPFIICRLIKSLLFVSGLFLECPGVTSVLLKTNLQHIQAPIQSLSIYDFDRTITTLTNDLFATSSSNGLAIKHLQFSNSNIQLLKENSLINLKESLESLSIVNGKLTNVSKHNSITLVS